MSIDNSYCRDLVRGSDPDRFLLSMFAGEPVRGALWAVLAFNYEIAKTREVVSDTTLGQIRLQWWRDAIAAVYDGGAVLDHEIVKPLAAAIQAHDLPREHFETLLHAREFDLEDVAPASLEGMLIYADHTSVPLFKLMVQISGGDPEVEPVQAIAVNYALVGMLRGVMFYAGQGRCLLPSDLMQEYGVSEAALYEGQPEEGLCKLVEEISGAYVGDVRSEDRVLNACSRLSDMYLGQIKRLKYNVSDPRIVRSPSCKVLRLLFLRYFK